MLETYRHVMLVEFTKVIIPITMPMNIPVVPDVGMILSTVVSSVAQLAMVVVGPVMTMAVVVFVLLQPLLESRR